MNLSDTQDPDETRCACGFCGGECGRLATDELDGTPVCELCGSHDGQQCGHELARDLRAVGRLLERAGRAERRTVPTLLESLTCDCGGAWCEADISGPIRQGWAEARWARERREERARR